MSATAMKSSLEIAQAHELRPIEEIAAAAGLRRDEIELYGDVKAKIKLSAVSERASSADSLIFALTSP